MEATSHTEVKTLRSLEVDYLLLNKIIQPNLLKAIARCLVPKMVKNGYKSDFVY